MLSNEEKLGKQINKIDSNKKDGLEFEEIDSFLSNEENLKKLGDIMQEKFEDNPEILQKYKENVGKICERILEKEDTINLNQGKILFFYLKEFHNENVGVGIDIIKTIVDGNKGNWYQEVLSNMANVSEQGSEEDDNQENMDDWFNNLPGVKEIKEERELKKCAQLLESEDLSLEDIQWLNQYKEIGDLDSGLINKIDEKIKVENLNKCNELLDSIGILVQEEIQWLKEYKDSLDKDSGQELIARIEERIKLNEVDQDITREVDRIIYSNPLGNIESICPGFGKVKPNWIAIINQIKPQDVIKVETEDDLKMIIEKVSTSITEENISEFLPLPDGISDQDKYYITNNFQSILIRHLLLHPGYKILWGLDPETKFATGMSLKSIVKENDLLETAFEKFESLKGGNKNLGFDKLTDSEKDKILNRIFQENNHILFDLRLRAELASCDEQQRGSVIAYVMNYGSKERYNSRLNTFRNNNSFIDDIYGEYLNAKIKAEVNELIIQSQIINVPENIQYLKGINGEEQFRVFSRSQLDGFRDYYNSVRDLRQGHEDWEKFCKLYEFSNEFYKSQWVKNLGLPNSLEAQDYIDFLGCFYNMQDEIEDIEIEFHKASSNRGFIPGNTGYGAGLAGEIGYYEGKKQVKKISAARKFVELWKKSKGSYRPDNFLGIPLKWEYSEIDDIIRDSFPKNLKDSVKSFWENATGGCFQQAVGDLVGLGFGMAFSASVMACTGSSALAGATFYLSSKCGNGLGQGAWDLVVDGLGKRVLGIGQELGANKYAGLNASLGLGMGLYERDKDGNVIQTKSDREFLIDTLFGAFGTALSFSIGDAFGISIQKTPLRYALIDEFFCSPASNMFAAGMKAGIGTPNYEGIGIREAMGDQATEEYFTAEGISKKLFNVALVTGMVSIANARSNSKSDIVKKIESGWGKLESLLKKEGIELGDLKNLTEKEMKSLMKKGLGGIVSNLSKEITKGWKSVVVPSIPLAANGLLCASISPLEVLHRKMKVLQSRMRESSSSAELATCTKLSQKYENLENYIENDMQNIDMDADEMVAYMESQGLGGLQENHLQSTNSEMEGKNGNNFEGNNSEGNKMDINNENFKSELNALKAEIFDNLQNQSDSGLTGEGISGRISFKDIEVNTGKLNKSGK